MYSYNTYYISFCFSISIFVNYCTEFFSLISVIIQYIFTYNIQ